MPLLEWRWGKNRSVATHPTLTGYPCCHGGDGPRTPKVPAEDRGGSCCGVARAASSVIVWALRGEGSAPDGAADHHSSGGSFARGWCGAPGRAAAARHYDGGSSARGWC
jgi:hypothetical protein